VTKLTVKMLTDLYGAHQDRGLAPRTVYQIHACLSSMLTQACRWGWRESNPAQWAEPPSIPNKEPTVPTPEEVRALIAEAERGKRPEMARAILVAATTGVRRAELCGLRWDRDVDLEHRVMRVSASVTKLRGRPIEEIPTKNRRERTLAIDDFTAAILRAQIEEVERRAEFAQVELVENPYVFTERPTDRCPGSRTPSRSTSAGCALGSVSITSTSTTYASSWRPTARRWATASPRSPCEPATTPASPPSTTAVA
jgi:integrase